MRREVLLRSQFRVGCPVMAAAVEEPIDDTADDALRAAAEVFDAWERQRVAAPKANGCERKAAAELATLLIASLDGAIVLCRATQHRAVRSRGEVDRGGGGGGVVAAWRGGWAEGNRRIEQLVIHRQRASAACP